MNHRSNFVLNHQSSKLLHIYFGTSIVVYSTFITSIVPSVILSCQFIPDLVVLSLPFFLSSFFFFFILFFFDQFVNHNVPFLVDARFVCQFRLPFSLPPSNTAHSRDTRWYWRRGKLAGINEFVRSRVLHRSNHPSRWNEKRTFRLQNGEIQDIVNIVFWVKSFGLNSRRFIDRMRVGDLR